jgi:serine/threonine protein kinase/Tfp pilus assembly protein PilF
MADLTGRQLGKYQIIERLGRGGMADVYKGFQPGLERYVAVKVMHEHLSEQPDFITRFKREAKSVAELRHPNIIQIFDFDVQDDVYYMVMEYIEGGRTLKETMQELAAKGERLPIKITLDTMGKLSDALQYAHAQGMIHRDLKPSNVLVKSLDRPVLSDFGIARILDQSQLTSSGAMVGTPAYMSPEQGRGEQADERSDIYAMGIMLYEMLTGKPPYDADTPYGIILKHINDPIISPLQIATDLPTLIEPIVLKALAKAREDRYQSAAELKAALAKAGEQMSGRVEDTAASHATPPVPMVAPSAGREDEGLTAQIERTPSPAPAQANKKPSAFSRIAFWKNWPRPAKIVGGLAAVLVCCFCAFLFIASWNGNQGQAEAELFGGNQAIAGAYTTLFNGDPAAAQTAFEQILTEEPENVRALAGEGIALLQNGKPDEAEKVLLRAAEKDPNSPLVNLGLGLLRTNEGNADAALPYFTRVTETCGAIRQLCAEGYYNRAQLQAWYYGDFTAALELINKAIQAQPETADQARLYAARADIRHGAGDGDAAVDDYHTAYTLSDKKATWYLESAASILLEQGKFDLAAKVYQTLYTDQNSDPGYLIGEAYVWFYKGTDYAKARALTTQALAADPDLLGAHYLDALLLHYVDKKPADALIEYEALIEHITDNAWGRWRYHAIISRQFDRDLLLDAAMAAADIGKMDRAVELTGKSIDFDGDWLPPHLLRGDIFLAQGKKSEALAEYQAAMAMVNSDTDQALKEEIQQKIDAAGK